MKDESQSGDFILDFEEESSSQPQPLIPEIISHQGSLGQEIISYKGQNKKNAEHEKILRAKAIYITSSLSIAEIAKKLKIKKSTLTGYAQRDGWNLYRSDVTLEEYALAAIRETEDAVYFHSKARELLQELLDDESYRTPKDIEIIVKTFILSSNESLRLKTVKFSKEEDYEDN